MKEILKSYHEVETVLDFTYLGDRVSAVGGCESAVNVRTKCIWVKLRECGELLYGRRKYCKRQCSIM